MSERYLAHIAEDGREQTVREHLEGTARRCIEFSKPFHAEFESEFSAKTHDVGKYTDGFQRRLHGGPKVDHSTAGAYLCFQHKQLAAAFCVAGHHSGLPDGGSRGDSLEQSTFMGRMQRAREGLLGDYSRWKDEIELPKGDIPGGMSSPLDDFFHIRMLYSCLVDADFLDTEEFMRGTPRQNCGNAGIDDLLARLNSHISKWFPPKGELNQQRCRILNKCIEQGKAQAPGIFKLTVPTGGGKTVASLAFALNHAAEKEKRRVIYVIPYTSIIEQTAQVFRDILGEENVLEHHSNFIFSEDDGVSAQHLRQASENWDAPVVVTTAVQFFESLYSNRSSQCRKLHNIAESVIIFDEAQMLPLPYLRPCVHAIAQLVENYGVSAVLCTATQPVLDHIFAEFTSAKAIEICPNEFYDPSIFRRTIIKKEGKFSWQKIADRMNDTAQSLCIVNSRRSAEMLYNLLNGDSCYCLTTFLYPAHRRRLIEEIKCRLADGLECRVVATSLIEAGVDVDFPMVLREENGLDSVLQAAGRCNREGKRPREESIVTVFRSEESDPPLFAARMGIGRMVMNAFDDPSDPKAIERYFNQLLIISGKEAQDKNRIIDTIKKRLFPFQTVAGLFKLIDTDTRTIYVPIGEGKELLDRYANGERTRRLFRSLGQYGVNVYINHFDKLMYAGAIQLMGDNDSAVLTDIELYDENTGLSMNADPGRALWG